VVGGDAKHETAGGEAKSFLESPHLRPATEVEPVETNGCRPKQEGGADRFSLCGGLQSGLNPFSDGADLRRRDSAVGDRNKSQLKDQKL